MVGGFAWGPESKNDNSQADIANHACWSGSPSCKPPDACVYIRQGSRGLRQYRICEARPRRAAAFIRRYADAFGSVQTEPRSDAKRVLVIGGVDSGKVEVELCLVKALELAGWRSMRLQVDGSNTTKEMIATYYSLLSSTAVRYWHDYFEPAAFRDKAETIVHSARSLEELLEFRVGAVRVGGHAVSTARRQLGAGTLDFRRRKHSNQVD